MRLLIALLCAWPSFGAIAFVQASNGGNGGSTTTVATSATAATAHNAIVAYAVHLSAACTTTAAITDTAGNTYYQFFERQEATNKCMRGFIARDITANATNVLTVTYGSSVTGAYVNELEFSGLERVTVRDMAIANSIQTNVANVALAAGPFSTFWADEVIVVGAISTVGSTWTADTGYTIPSGATDSGNIITAEYKIVSARQTAVTASITSDQVGTVIMIGVSLLVPVPRAANTGYAQ